GEGIAAQHDERAFLVSFRFRQELDRKLEKPAVDRLEGFLADLRAQNPELSTALLGAKIASAAFLGEMGFQQRVITPLLLLALVIFLWLCYRSWQIVAWNLFVMLVCYAATLCLIILIEGGLGPYSSFALMFAFIVATTDFIHYFGRFQQVEGTTPERLAKTRKLAFVPCLLTSLTTAAGFIALVVNQNLPIRYFGLYCAFSCMLEWVIIFCVLPQLLIAFNFDPGTKSWKMPVLSKAIAPFINRYATSAVAISMILLAVSVVASLSLKIDDNFYTKFVKNHSLSRAIELFSEQFDFVGSIDVIVERGDRALDSPAAQADLRDLERELAAHPVVSKISSFRQVEDTLDSEIAKAGIDPDRRLETRNSVLRLLLDYGSLRDFVNETKGEVRTIVFLKSLATEDLDQVLALIDELKAKYASKFEIRAAGFSVIRSFINSRVISDFFESFILSFILIFLCYVYLYRSIKWSL
ncbi:MAG: MMPL family transporter, partial [Bdellovibrionota bacterium]